jgi:hypothetical protein
MNETGTRANQRNAIFGISVLGIKPESTLISAPIRSDYTAHKLIYKAKTTFVIEKPDDSLPSWTALRNRKRSLSISSRETIPRKPAKHDPVIQVTSSNRKAV